MLGDGEDDGGTGVIGGLTTPRGLPHANGAEVADADGDAVSQGDDRFGDVGEGVDAAFTGDEPFAAVLVDDAGRDVFVALGEGAPDVVERDLMGGEEGGVEDRLELAFITAHVEGVVTGTVAVADHVVAALAEDHAGELRVVAPHGGPGPECLGERQDRGADLVRGRRDLLGRDGGEHDRQREHRGGEVGHAR